MNMPRQRRHKQRRVDILAGVGCKRCTGGAGGVYGVYDMKVVKGGRNREHWCLVEVESSPAQINDDGLRIPLRDQKLPNEHGTHHECTTVYLVVLSPRNLRIPGARVRRSDFAADYPHAMTTSEGIPVENS